MDNTEEIKKNNCPLCKYKTNKPSNWIKHTNSKNMNVMVKENKFIVIFVIMNH